MAIRFSLLTNEHHRNTYRLPPHLPPLTLAFANGIQIEHNSQIVVEGKLIAETTYPDIIRKYTE